jgi:dolichyl-phosphate-mannose--protein O-mannosyl transferase
MFVSLLVMLFWSSIPFLAEYEHIGTKTSLPITVGGVAQLRWFRQQRWGRWFAVLWLLVAAMALAPAASGKNHAVTWGMVATIVCAQGFLWAGVYAKIRKARANRPPSQ